MPSVAYWTTSGPGRSLILAPGLHGLSSVSLISSVLAPPTQLYTDTWHPCIGACMATCHVNAIGSLHGNDSPRRLTLGAAIDGWMAKPAVFSRRSPHRCQIRAPLPSPSSQSPPLSLSRSLLSSRSAKMYRSPEAKRARGSAATTPPTPTTGSSASQGHHADQRGPALGYDASGSSSAQAYHTKGTPPAPADAHAASHNPAQPALLVRATPT